MINLKIDPEFQSQIPPLTDDEFKQLEENILKEGKLISPLIVWGNTLVDGHNRYEIVQEHPEISFSTMPLPFESREEVLAWICKNQLGRRNLTPEQTKTRTLGSALCRRMPRDRSKRQPPRTKARQSAFSSFFSSVSLRSQDFHIPITYIFYIVFLQTSRT